MLRTGRLVQKDIVYIAQVICEAYKWTMFSPERRCSHGKQSYGSIPPKKVKKIEHIVKVVLDSLKPDSARYNAEAIQNRNRVIERQHAAYMVSLQKRKTYLGISEIKFIRANVLGTILDRLVNLRKLPNNKFRLVYRQLAAMVCSTSDTLEPCNRTPLHQIDKKIIAKIGSAVRIIMRELKKKQSGVKAKRTIDTVMRRSRRKK